jgi:hypothetical protein
MGANWLPMDYWTGAHYRPHRVPAYANVLMVCTPNNRGNLINLQPTSDRQTLNVRRHRPELMSALPAGRVSTQKYRFFRNDWIPEELIGKQRDDPSHFRA